jgi:hypothetical protein
LWKHIKQAVNWVWNWIKTNYATLVQLAITTALSFTPIGPIGAAAIGGFAAGMISSKGNLKVALMGAAISAAEAFAFYGVGKWAAFENPTFSSITENPGSLVKAVVGHAAIGCAFAEAQGGACGPAALSGALSAAVGPVAGEIGDTSSLRFAGSLALSSAAGGVGSVLGGGKFADGAITGAFGYLFNEGGKTVDDWLIDFLEWFGRAQEYADGGVGNALNAMAGAVDINAGMGLGARGVPQAGSALEGANFAQKTYSGTFSSSGTYAGMTVQDLSAAIRSGRVGVADVPIQYIVRGGNTLILNTRSAQALTQAGVPRSSWNAVNMTGNAAAEARLTQQLKRNNLTNEGTPTVKP